MQYRAGLGGEEGIGVSDPGDAAGGIERSIGEAAEGMFVKDSGFFEQKGDADIIGMADEGKLQVEPRINERPQIPDHAVVSGEEFVKGSGGGEVLVFENDG